MIKKVGREEVAKATGVSESTVSRALSDSPRISEEVKKRVKAKAEELGYFPSRPAEQFALGRSNSIGLVVPYYEKILPFSRSYFPALLDGILIGTMNAGYNVGIVIDKKLGRYRNFSELIQSRSFDGLIFAVTPYHYGGLQTLVSDKLPFVLVNNYQEGVSSVYAKPYQGMEKAFLHAASLGHESIGYITGDLSYLNGQDRLESFQTLAKKFRMKTEIVEGDFSHRSGYESFSRFDGKLGQDITLVMTASDREAIGLITACREKGINVPDDLSVIGFDNFFAASNTVPALTTVNHPITSMGTEAARLLIKMVNSPQYNPEQIWVDTGFVIRNSTGKRRKP